jgi:hypothetical protein
VWIGNEREREMPTFPFSSELIEQNLLKRRELDISHSHSISFTSHEQCKYQFSTQSLLRIK